MATVGEWLDGRVPPPPSELRERVFAALGDDLRAPDTEAHERCLLAGERLLGALLADGAATRAAALDLLAADALVTYAFEAAAEQPDLLGKRADEAMRRLSGLGASAAPRS